MSRTILGGACAAVVFCLLAGCGGSAVTPASTAGGSQSTGSGGTQTQIQGIATPSSVSVVTAKNSN